MNPFLKISSAFGLSSAAGLNAYIPLLLLSVMANRGIIHLAPQYAFFASPWCIGILSVLCVIELIVDKIPGADHVNDIIQTFIRPTAGAILFAAQAGTISSAHPAVFLVLGLLTAGGVHAVKAVARPAINVTTFGIGAPVASTLENFTSTMLALVALLFPVLSLVFMIFCGWILFKMFRRFTRKGAANVDGGEKIIDAAPATLPAASPNTWQGGV